MTQTATRLTAGRLARRLLGVAAAVGACGFLLGFCTAVAI